MAYEMRGNNRPFVVHSNTPLAEIKNILNTPVHYPRYWSSQFVDLLQKVGLDADIRLVAEGSSVAL